MEKSRARTFVGSLSRRTVWVIAVLAVVIVVSAGAGILFDSAAKAATPAANLASTATQAASSPAESVAKILGPSVVNIKVGYGQQYSAEGSGVIYRADGMIITNNHVVTDESSGNTVSSIKVTLATGEQLDGTLVGHDPSTEIAVIKVNAGHDLPAATFVKDLPAVGAYAVAIGSPLGYENSVTLGIVSGLSRKIDGVTGTEGAALSNLIQTDAPISPGNSGGALANSAGEVIGINVAYEPPAQTGAVSIGFAIPAATATSVADQLISTGSANNSNNNGGNSNGSGDNGNVVPQAYLGVGTIDVTPDLQQQYGLSQSSGALVAEVAQGSPAETAGLQQGDIIVKADGKDVTGTADLYKIDQTKKPGDQVQLTVDRNGQQGTVTVTLGERPANAQ
jgi:S1-C subfamily serine protease